MSSLESFIERTCTQTAVYWGNPTEVGDGSRTYDTPVEISCRWQDVVKVIVGDGIGEIEVSKAEVVVTEDLDTNGLLYLGTLDDLDSADEENPEDIADAFIIKKFDRIPALGSTTEFFRKAYL